MVCLGLNGNEGNKNGLQLVASNNSEDEALFIHQDAKIYYGNLEGREESFGLGKGRGGWIQMIDGELKVNDITLKKGDGLSIENMTEFNLQDLKKSRFLLFDLA